MCERAGGRLSNGKREREMERERERERERELSGVCEREIGER